MVTVTTFTAIINQILPEPHAGLLNGILFGTKKAVSKDLLDAMITTGTSYLVVLNGMNISVITGLAMTTLLRFVSRRVASLLTILFIIGFVWFVGITPSVLRAAIMGSLTLITILFGRQVWKLFIYGVTIAVMLIIKPSWISDLSFQISALATLGIILFMKRSPLVSLRGVFDEAISKDRHASLAMTILKFIYSIIADSLRLTLSAQVFTIPLIFMTFRQISLVSPLTNLLVGWIIAPITVIGMAAAILGWIFLPLGYVFGWVSWVMLEYILIVIQLSAKLPFSSISY